MVDCMQRYDFSDIPVVFEGSSCMVKVEMGRQNREQVILQPICLCGKSVYIYLEEDSITLWLFGLTPIKRCAQTLQDLLRKY